MLDPITLSLIGVAVASAGGIGGASVVLYKIIHNLKEANASLKERNVTLKREFEEVVEKLTKGINVLRERDQQWQKQLDKPAERRAAEWKQQAVVATEGQAKAEQRAEAAEESEKALKERVAVLEDYLKKALRSVEGTLQAYHQQTLLTQKQTERAENAEQREHLLQEKLDSTQTEHQVKDQCLQDLFELFNSPISLRLLEADVVTAPDGRSYGREELIEWYTNQLRSNGGRYAFCPFDASKPLPNPATLPRNHVIGSAIELLQQVKTTLALGSNSGSLETSLTNGNVNATGSSNSDVNATVSTNANPNARAQLRLFSAGEGQHPAQELDAQSGASRLRANNVPSSRP